MKKILTILLAFIIGSVSMYFLLAFTSEPKTDTDTKSAIVSRDHNPMQALSLSSSITCTYPQFLNASYSDNKINHELPKPETNPIIITFTDLTEDIATLRFVDSTQTVNAVNAVKVYEDTQKIVLIEGLNGTYATLHTIFLDKNIAVNSKQLDVLGIAISSGNAIGHCR